METGKIYCKNGHVQVSCTIIILFNEGSSSSQPVYWLRISVSNQFSMTYLRNSAGQIVLIFGIRYEFKMCNVLTVTFHDWALNFHWFHLFRNKGKDAQKG